MTGGLLQLAFKGPQDVYLTGNPQMTFFKSVYKQHSNFTKDTQILQFENDIKLGTNHYCVIKRYGDLLSNLYLYIGSTRQFCCQFYQFCRFMTKQSKWIAIWSPSDLLFSCFFFWRLADHKSFQKRGG